jgi:hypothetical protein
LEFIDRVNSKDDIQVEASKYIMTFLKYYGYKKKIIKELEKQKSDKVKVNKGVEKLKETIYEKMSHKKNFKKFIQYISFNLACLEMYIIYQTIMII